MDWVMVSNAREPAQRVKTLFYLTRFRYEEDARAGGEHLAADAPKNPLCRETIAELRANWKCPRGIWV